MIARYTGANQRVFLTDALGSVIGQARSDQSIQNWYRYSAYGEAVATAGDEGNDIEYTGRENDDTGLYYYRARYYDPVLKRFISEDPIGLEGGLNPYAYVNGNPLSYVDPLGLQGDPINLPTTPSGQPIDVILLFPPVDPVPVSVLQSILNNILGPVSRAATSLLCPTPPPPRSSPGGGGLRG